MEVLTISLGEDMLFRMQFVFWLLGVPAIVFGAITDHLKTAPNKGSNHNMRNIDFIYMINLDQRPEKWKLSNQQLNPYGIYPYRFSAVNGWELSCEAINDVGVKFKKGMDSGFWGTSFLPDTDMQQTHSIIGKEGQTYFCHCMGRGTIGIVLSHLSILRDALESGYERIWVMEDDIEVVSDPLEIPALIDKLDKYTNGKWDILFTDRNTRDAHGREIPSYGYARRPNFIPTKKKQYYLNHPYHAEFIRLGSRFGAYSMILSRSGMEKIYRFITTYSVFFPYDMDYHLPPHIQIYTVRKNVVSHVLNGVSDNAKPTYLHQ